MCPRHCRWPRATWSIWLPSLPFWARFCSPFWLPGIFETCRIRVCGGTAGLMMTGAVTSVEAALEAGHDGASRREGVSPGGARREGRKAGERGSLKLQEASADRLPVRAAALFERRDHHHCFLGLNSTRPITSPKSRSTAASRKSAVSVSLGKSRKSCRPGWGGSGEELRSGCMDASWSCYRANSMDFADSTAYRPAWADASGAEIGSGKVLSISSSSRSDYQGTKDRSDYGPLAGVAVSHENPPLICHPP
jgi:hypothetical protein